MTQRTWLITGVSGGFGRQLAEQMLTRGDRVAGPVVSDGDDGTPYRPGSCTSTDVRLSTGRLEAMDTRVIGNDGLEVSALRLGCMGMNVNYGPPEDRQPHAASGDQPRRWTRHPVRRLLL